MRRNKLILLLAILLVTIGQCVDVYLPSMPSMAVALHASVTSIQLSITITMVAVGIMLFVYGPLSDYFGRRKVALFGIGLFIMGAILCFCATNITMLIIGRVIQGLGIACGGAVAPATLRDVFTGYELVKTFSQFSMAITTASVVTPVLGGYLQHHFNWRAPFVFLFLYSSTVFLLYLFLFPETNRQLKQSDIHLIKIIKNYMTILIDVRYLVFIFSIMFMFAGEVSYAVVAPFLYQNQLGLTPVLTGWLIFATIFGCLLGTFISSHVCKWLGILQLMTIGTCIAFLGGTMMLFFAWLHWFSLMVILIPMIIFMFGSGFVYPNAVAGCMSCHPEKAGMAGGVMGALQMGGAGIIVSVMSHMHVNNQLPLGIFLVSLSILTVILLVVLFWQSQANYV